MKHCIVCKNSKLKPYLVSGSNYKLSTCLNCNYIFDPKPPTAPTNIYSKDYYVSPEIKGGYSNYFEESVVNKLTFRYRLKKIHKLMGTTNLKLLDIGCALGDFLEVAKGLLWEKVIGVDVSAYAIEICQKKGLAAYTIKDLTNEKKLRKNSFDVITMQDVIEHYEHPEKELLKIYTLLKPGGLLFLTTPNSSSISLQLLKSHWYHFKPKEHLAYFNPNNIKQLLHSTGFIQIEAKPTPSWVTPQYLIERMHYYFPQLTSKFLVKATNNPLFQIAFPMHTGEMEVWAFKPMTYEKS